MFNGITTEDIAGIRFRPQAPTMTSPSLAVRLTDPRCMPRRANYDDAGADLVSVVKEIIYPNEMVLVDTGVSVKIPSGYVGYVFSRSGQGRIRVHLANSVGVIDAQYRGNIKVMLVNEGDDPYEIHPYVTKIAQLVVSPVMLPTFRESGESEQEWQNTTRGTGGFGSTG